MLIWLLVIFMPNGLNATLSRMVVDMFHPYDPNDVYFEFYTNYKDLTTLKTIRNTRDMLDVDIPDEFDTSKQTFAYVHGFSTFPEIQLEQFKMFHDNKGTECCNFIGLNWYYSSIGNYWKIRKRTPEVSFFATRLPIATL